MNYFEYLSNEQYKSDNISRQDFGEMLMLAFKQKNISEGCQWFQAIHLHERVRSWVVTYPTPAQFPHPAYAELGLTIGGQTKTVDLFNMIKGGDIETACLSLKFGQNDDMTSPVHWVTDERRLWLIEQMERWLGWIT
jgi:hypothetical protein